MFCTQCGKENPDGATFCSRCGGALGAKDSRRTQARPAPRKKNWFWLVPAALLVVILTMVGILIVRSHQRQAEPETVIIDAVEDTDPAAAYSEDTESAPAAPLDVRVEFERATEDMQEYARLRAYTPEGALLWEKETGRCSITELNQVGWIGNDGWRCYYVESGSVIALDLADGTELWRNAEFQGAGVDESSSLIDGETIYLCGYYGPDFFALDTRGNTLKRIEELDGEFFWAFRMEKADEKTVAVSLAGGPMGDIGYDPMILYVDTEDYSIRYTRISEEEAARIGAEHWDFQEGDVAEETGYPLGVLSGWTETAPNGRLCYVVQFQWLVDNDHWSVLDRIFVDADTGEIYDYYS